ncbi:hypothetical protein HK098_003411 [Nowakowskiella sp. JEL0407]|nr:hypothetical protein HK098_003411 [Nowakowskiella sp. JEL0407]
MAQLEESLQRKRRQELQRKKKEFIRLETQRSKEAGVEFRREVHKRNESMEKKLKALEKVNQIEKERTARIVEKQKIHASKAVNQYFDQTVLSKPKMNELKQKSYDRTTFHNNHAAVRCEGTTYDARAVAPMVQKQLEVRLIDEEKRRISSQQKADSRFDTALIDVKMEKTKNNLMDEIGILDRKRRQIASSNVSYKPKYAQQQLESEFLQRFIV